MYKVVITGGPGSGKTTIIEAFEKERYKVVHESAIKVIGALNDLIGIEEQKRWRLENPGAFQSLLAPKQIREELLIQGGDYVFLDRSALDNLGYCELNRAEIPSVLKNFRPDYDLAVVCDTLSNYDSRAKTGRTSNRERSLEIRDALRKVYIRHGIDVMDLVEMSVGKRVLAIKERLGIV